MSVLLTQPDDEAARLAMLRDYGLLDTPPDENLDRITRLAAMMMNAPVSTVSLIDADRQFFLARTGVANCIAPRKGSFCTHVVEHGGPLIVRDAQIDVRFRDSPYVTGAPHIRFYLGVPLVTPSRTVLGTLCVYDFAPRDDVLPAQVAAIYDLARLVVDSIEFRRIAVHDSLTNLLTKGAFAEAANQEIDRGRRSGRLPVCVLIDIDHFKSINDTHGHPVGDEVLRAVSDIIVKQIRPYDLTGRIGGEEFAVVLPECEPDKARDLAERLRQALESAKILAGDVHVPVTASLGVSGVLPEETTIAAAIARADKALYQSKAAGRNRVTAVTA
jgi:diguanylate cyclase (GGDEF)-like protein